MKFNLSFVYCILLLISVVSSGLLFIIVACEGTKTSNEQTSTSDRSDEPLATLVNNNITVDDTGGGEIINPVTFENRLTNSDKLVVNDIKNFEKKIEDPKSDSTPPPPPPPTIITNNKKTENLPGLELFAEGLTQQPNLSQGVPETDQAVVLTLVDAAAAELQSLAGDGRLSLDKRSAKSVVNNLTITLRDSGASQMPSPSRLPTLADLDPNGSLEGVQNLTSDEEPEFQLQDLQDEGENIDVVIVRADQSKAGIKTFDIPIDDDNPIDVEVPGTNDNVESTSELPEIEARARLAGGGTTEDASLMLDVLVAGTGTDPHEDIPSFSEWAQKRLEEAEKKKPHPNASSQNPSGPGGRGTGSTKVRSKNYASPDCGSKIVAANPEAGSASSVLSSSRDEYMLNTCTSRVWFVVELCEAIQAEKIELANFELFSSSPKDFSVYVGDRFPSRDWSAVGQFTAKDERDIQSFALHPRLFGKFVKIELHSHYGSEHFCPISLFRVYGTSEFEVLETENQIQESLGDLDDGEDEEEMLDVDTGDPPRNLFGSARDAVLSIVKKAAEVLVKSGDAVNNNTKIRESIEDTILQNSLIAACVTPKYKIICNDCTETMFAKVSQLVSCSDNYLTGLLRVNLINQTLCQSSICPSHGVRAKEPNKSGHMSLTKNDPVARFLAALFPSHYIVALCNVLAARENRVIVNARYYVTGNNSEGAATLEDSLIAPPQGVPTTTYEGSTVSTNQQQTTRCTTEENSPSCKPSVLSDQIKSGVDYSTPTASDTGASIEEVASSIKPTKTLTRDEGSGKESISDPSLEPSRKPTEESTFFETSTSSSSPNHHQTTIVDKVNEDSGIQDAGFETTSRNTLTTASSTESNSEGGDFAGKSESGEAVVVAESEQEPEPDREQEVKISVQDQISLDSLLSDLKDLDAESVTMQNIAAVPSATFSQPTPSPQQKESVFLRLSNRIKTLERNMSLSGQYLEELSKRYKKQVEEMQRSLERSIAVMGEESRRSEERDVKRLEEIKELKEQVSTLTRSLNSLINDRDNWRSKLSLIGQHVVLVCVEIVIILLVLSYCRRHADYEDEIEGSSTSAETTRRKSVEVTTKKMKKRRPSEIASHISTSYKELMIEEPSTSYDNVKKERKRKRKRETIGKIPIVTISNFPTIKPVRQDSLNCGNNLPSRRASSSDAAKYSQTSLSAGDDNRRRPESAPENCSGWFSDQKQSSDIQITVSSASNQSLAISEEIRERGNRGVEEIKKGESSPTRVKNSEAKISVGLKSGGILKNRRISSPAFMKTALGSRSKRLTEKNETSPVLKSENWEWYSKNSSSRSSQDDDNRASPTPSAILKLVVTEGGGFINGNSIINGKYEESDDSISRSTTPSNDSRKEKKTYGLKKMVKKFF